MTTHHLHLHPEPFEYIRSGKKTIESRLFDEKRSKYQLGDTLIFSNRGNEAESIETKIIALYREQTFRDLFLNKMTTGKFSTNSVDELLKGIENYYTQVDQEKYGVVGIEFVVN